MLGEYTHSFHPYPAKFPPEAIHDSIEKYTRPGDTVLDPFCGSGTTLVECRLLARNAIGIELNPVGALVSRAKSTLYTHADLEVLSSVIEALKSASSDSRVWLSTNRASVDIPDYPNRDHWFKKDVQVELAAIKRSFVDEYSANPHVLDLLQTAFSRIIVPVSNQDSETRYATIDKSVEQGDALRLFTRTLSGYLRALSARATDSCSDAWVRVVQGNAAEELRKLCPDSVDLAVTSPPYINSFDYYLYHKQRIYWLGGDPRAVRRLEIGLHHRVDTQSYATATQEYLESMEAVFQGVGRALRAGSRFVILIGDGIVKGKVVEMVPIIRSVARVTGFSEESVESRPLRQVSRRFIKEDRIDRKQHHIITLIKESREQL